MSCIFYDSQVFNNFFKTIKNFEKFFEINLAEYILSFVSWYRNISIRKIIIRKPKEGNISIRHRRKTNRLIVWFRIQNV